MPRVTLLAAAFLLTISTGAAAQTLLGEEIESGGYGGPALRFTSINSDFGVMVGGQGAWVVGGTFGIGGAGFGVTTEHELSNLGTEYELSFSYGGVLFEYFVDSSKLTHYYVSLIVGAGGVSVGQRGAESDDDDTVFVLEPSVHLGLRVTKEFRLGFGVGYRVVSGLKSSMETEFGLVSADLAGLFASVSFRFGKY